MLELEDQEAFVRANMSGGDSGSAQQVDDKDTFEDAPALERSPVGGLENADEEELSESQ